MTYWKFVFVFCSIASLILPVSANSQTQEDIGKIDVADMDMEVPCFLYKSYRLSLTVKHLLRWWIEEGCYG
ncbi:MAG: hypothetical protein WC329_03725 [Candidatus Omnitrophota bacterium]|jgi:hypothetical protein